MKTVRATLGAMCLLALCGSGSAQDDVADVPSEEIVIGGDAKKKYYLIGAAKDRKAPDQGFGLLLVLPGGDGSADFHPFVKRIFKFQSPDGYLVAQAVAPKWSARQEVTWPTAKLKTPGMKWTTEEFLTAIIDDVSSRQKIDPRKVLTLSWSSGGPAAYTAALTDERIRGSFVAMSVYKPGLMPPLTNAKGRAFYLYHSEADRVCPFRFAEQAAKELKANGATLELAKYEGGHGWVAGMGGIGPGLTWLDTQVTSGASK